MNRAAVTVTVTVTVTVAQVLGGGSRPYVLGAGQELEQIAPVPAGALA